MTSLLMVSFTFFSLSSLSFPLGLLIYILEPTLHLSSLIHSSTTSEFIWYGALHTYQNLFCPAVHF